MRIVSGAAAAALLLCHASQAGAEDTWTYPVLVWEPPLASPFAPDVTFTPGTYEAMDAGRVTQKWQICVAMPNMNDDYYVAMNFGAVAEAERLGVQMTMLSAGGYGNLSTQINQVEDCVAQGVDAILIMAISPTGLNQTITEARERGIVVVDLANGIDSPEIQARSKASWYTIGTALGEYLARRHPEGSGEQEVLWLPGPSGASWSEDLNRGFQDALSASESDIVVAATQYGDTHRNAQIPLVEDGLMTYPELDYIVGSAQAVDAAVQILREQGRQDDVNLVSSWITPRIDQIIREGLVLGAVTDSMVIQTRIGIDQAVRILEGEPFIQDVGPAIVAIDRESIETYDPYSSMAPEGWSVTFQVD